MVKQAVVIAGGSGSRLINSGINVAKPLIRIEGKSLLEWQILNLEREGISEILLLLGLKSNQIIDHVNEIKYKTSINFHFVIEDSPLGTGGALLNASHFLDETFLVLYGDILIDTSLRKLLSDAEASEFGSIGIRPSDHPLDSDLVKTDFNNEVVKIYPKPNIRSERRMNLAMTGLMCLKKNLLNEIERTSESKKLDLEKNLITSTITAKGGFTSSRLSGYIRDLGTVDRLEKAEESWISRTKANELHKAVILDRDGVINYFAGNVKNLKEFRIVDDLLLSVRMLRNAKFKIFVATNQPGIAKGFLSWDELLLLHGSVDMELAKENFFLDGWYVCPHHPEKGFLGEISKFKVDCLCRKPKDGLIKQIDEDFPLDFQKSWFVGDQISDFQLARSVGLSFVQIGDSFSAPDATPKFNKLEYACNYIVNHDKLNK
jgi:mannose-1-phosphate guanylyltransferase/phosphomannomutase